MVGFQNFFKRAIKKAPEKVFNYIVNNKDFFEKDFFYENGKNKKNLWMYDCCFYDKKTKEKKYFTIFGQSFLTQLEKFFPKNIEITITKVSRLRAKNLIAGGAKIYDIKESI